MRQLYIRSRNRIRKNVKISCLEVQENKRKKAHIKIKIRFKVIH